jgi:hypothetical protein
MPVPRRIFRKAKQKLDDTALPVFLQTTIETDAAGSPEDYTQYEYSDI